MISALFKYLFLSCFTSLRYLFLAFPIITTTFYNIFYNNNFTTAKCSFENINKSHTSLCLTNVFIFDQKETISVSSTPSSSITSYNLVIFYFIGAILSSIFYKKDNFNITKQLFPFLIYFFLCFSANSLHKSKNCDLKCCPNNEFFSTELIKITSDINSAERLMSSRYSALNKLRIKYNECFKFYHLLILLSGDVSLNLGPCQYLPDNDNKFQLFCKRGLRFLHKNVNSLLSKIDELRHFVGRTKPGALGITESKLESSVSYQEVNISGYSILRSYSNRYGGGNVFSNSIENVFFDLTIPRLKPLSIGIFYRPPNVNTFLETL